MHYEGHNSNNKALHFVPLCFVRIRMSEGSSVLINISTFLYLKGNICFQGAITGEKVPQFRVQLTVKGSESFYSWWFFMNEQRKIFLFNHFSAMDYK